KLPRPSLWLRQGSGDVTNSSSRVAAIGGGFADRLDESAFYAMAQSLAAALMECQPSPRTGAPPPGLCWMPPSCFLHQTRASGSRSGSGLPAFADALEAEQRSRWGVPRLGTGPVLMRMSLTYSSIINSL
uniref:Ketoacyl_synth_N domain-containing protein n=1 Tax=Macrostomum lignano TaxID=282301 RepID=A0A1I8FP10_9PLAT